MIFMSPSMNVRLMLMKKINFSPENLFRKVIIGIIR